MSGGIMIKDMVFVFGSNELGIHGGGAARVAREEYGAILGQGFGPQGNSFAIPTCAKPMGQPGCEIELGQIAVYVMRFRDYAREHQERNFRITQIGCGLAGWTAEQIAPLFQDVPPDNCYFDSAWAGPLFAADLAVIGEPGKAPAHVRKFWGTF